MSLQVLQDKAAKNFSDKNPNAAFDPASLLMLFEVLAGLLGAFKNCGKSPSQALEMAKNPSFLQKRFVVMKVRQMVGFSGMRKYGDDFVDAILKTGREVTKEEVAVAFDDLDS